MQKELSGLGMEPRTSQLRCVDWYRGITLFRMLAERQWNYLSYLRRAQQTAAASTLRPQAPSNVVDWCAWGLFDEVVFAHIHIVSLTMVSSSRTLSLQQF